PLMCLTPLPAPSILTNNPPFKKKNQKKSPSSPTFFLVFRPESSTLPVNLISGLNPLKPAVVAPAPPSGLHSASDYVSGVILRAPLSFTPLRVVSLLHRNSPLRGS